MMKLSQAIRKGCESTKKHQGALLRKTFSEENNGKISREITHACALGAAILGKIGRGKNNHDYNGYDISLLFPIADLRLTDVPRFLIPQDLLKTVESDYINMKYYFKIDNREQSQLSYAIVHLNDKTGWSRKAIAEWVETIEDYVETQKEATGLSKKIEKLVDIRSRSFSSKEATSEH